MKYLIVVVVIALGVLGGAAARAMVADLTDPACTVSTSDVHLTNPDPAHADVDIYTEAACGVDSTTP